MRCPLSRSPSSQLDEWDPQPRHSSSESVHKPLEPWRLSLSVELSFTVAFGVGKLYANTRNEQVLIANNN